MSEQKPVSPLLDSFVIGAPLSSHDGIRCCPAMKENSDEKYIVKIISVPESQVQLDALLLTGACKTPADAQDYFHEVADGITKEVEFLNATARLEGFLPFEGWQTAPKEEGIGYDVWLLSTYRRSLAKIFRRRPITHLEAVNLGLDMCTALAICRRAGYLYVNLKPSNIFLTKKKEFCIGDLGFVALDSLAYTSMPGKYRSPYSPPEAQDDLKTLNETADTYALGMILYQIYNEGTLPEAPRNPKDPFPCPANADYEISAIIMKAVDPDPANRWESPMEMGQALVGYLQRNSVNNVPITPPTGILPAKEDVPAEPVPSEVTAEIPVPGEGTAETPVPSEPEAPAEEPVTEPSPAEAETAADSPMEFPEPPQLLPEEPEVMEPEVSPVVLSESEEEEDDLDFSIAFQDTPVIEEPKEEKPAASVATITRQQQRQHREKIQKIKRTVSLIVTLVILVALVIGCIWFHQNIYLQPIHSLTVEGTQNQLTVTVDAALDERKLTVTCTDTYGNTSKKPLQNGQATFTDLLPGSLYRIELETEGFYELTGKTAEIFTTETLTNVVSMSAVAGAEDGSVMVNFTVDGSDPEQWTITCSAEGEEDIVETFTGHSVTVRGLTVGKEYTLRLGSADGAEILGQSSIAYQASELVLAQNLTILFVENGTMAVSWSAPEDTMVEYWTVRCYNDDGHEETLEITGTEISFTGIREDVGYTVEVTAAGMTEPVRVSISANPLAITQLNADTSDPEQITLTWDYEGTAPAGGWVLLYSFEGYPDQQFAVKCDTSKAVIDTHIPGATYNVTIQTADGTSIFSNTHSFSCPNVGIFTNQGMSGEKTTAFLLKTPAEEGWTCESVGNNAFTNTFQSGDSISVVLKSASNFYLPEMDIEVLYVIRDGNGHVLSKYISRETIDWKALWYDDDYHNGELTIPVVPTEPGDYSVSIYFNNLAVTSTTFTITE